jgi:hypothetical protein
MLSLRESNDQKSNILKYFDDFVELSYCDHYCHIYFEYKETSAVIEDTCVRDFTPSLFET